MKNQTLKLISILTIILVTLVMSVVSVSAVAELDIVSDMALGGSSSDRGEDLTYTVKVENTGDDNLSGFNIIINEKENFFESISFDETDIPAVLNVGDTFEFDINYEISWEKDSDEEDAGSITISASGFTETKDLTLEAKSYLRITEVEVYVDGDQEDEDDEIKVRDNEEIKIILTIENTYDDDDNIEIENVFFEIDSNGDWDFADGEESDEEDIKEDSEETFELVFDIDEDDIDDETIRFTLIAKGEDEEHGFIHYDYETVEFEFYNPSDELEITEFKFEESKVDCSQGYVDLFIEIENTGSNDQEKAMLWVTSKELDWYPSRITGLEIDEDDTWTYTFKVPVNKEDGMYFVEAKVYNDDFDEVDVETIVLDIDCSTTNITPENNETDSEEEEEEDSPNNSSDLEYEEPRAGSKLFIRNLWDWIKSLFD